MVAIVVRTARKPRRCDVRRCLIRPGHRYLRHVHFPGTDPELATGKRPSVFLECVGCACEYPQSRPVPVSTLGACESFCCSLEPCARPFNHPGGCSCRRCPEETEVDEVDKRLCEVRRRLDGLVRQGDSQAGEFAAGFRYALQQVAAHLDAVLSPPMNEET